MKPLLPVPSKKIYGYVRADCIAPQGGSTRPATIQSPIAARLFRTGAPRLGSTTFYRPSLRDETIKRFSLCGWNLHGNARIDLSNTFAPISEWTTMLAFLMPGLPELIIVGVFVLVPVAVVVTLVIALTRNRKPSESNPNLRPCLDCGQFVSLHATACPHCGCPLQAQQ